MNILVGYTGFVGSNLVDTMHFDLLLNSKNVELGYGTNPDLLVYAGVTGTKFLANLNPDMDSAVIENAKKNIKAINPKRLVLISTVDVYDDLQSKDEFYESNINNLCIYGKNRKELELWVEREIQNYHIVRIPALYGKNLKKNYVNDLINPIPKFLDKTTMRDIETEFPDIYDYYILNNNGYYTYNSQFQNKRIYKYFKFSEYNSLRFTDSRAQYQFINLKLLCDYLRFAISNEISVVNVVTEPIGADELKKEVDGETFVNYITETPIKYNLKTRYAPHTNYFLKKEEVLEDLKKFILSERKKITG